MGTSGLRMSLMYSDMCYVGWPLAETMGLPGGGGVVAVLVNLG